MAKPDMQLRKPAKPRLSTSGPLKRIEDLPPLERLTKIGFVPAGTWSCEGDVLRVNFEAHSDAFNVLHALVIGEEVMYIGKSTRTLATRLDGYCKPSASQLTNVKNNRNLKEVLKGGKRVDVYALPDNGSLHYGGFHVNLAAGLEDSLIRTLRPKWNGAPSRATPHVSA